MDAKHLKQAADQLEEAANALLALSGTFRAAAGGGKGESGDGKAGGKPAARAGAAKPGKGKAKEEADEDLTVDTVRDKLRELVDAKGKEKMVEALESVGAGKLADVDESQYQELMDKAQELIDAEEEEEQEEKPAKGKKPAAKKAKKGPTEDDVKEKAQELVDADKKAELAKLLKKFKAKKVSELDEEHYADFIEAADEALGEEEDLVG